MQFWYHTQLIDKMGILEYILVTPSHHRVHHAINPEYIDKNYSQILIIWDKIFGTFQPELKQVKPVYGTLKPVQTWNPIIINYKHMWQLVKDCWRTRSFIDKVRVWFMPTGLRPEDVKEKYPVELILNPDDQVKYTRDSSRLLLGWSWAQLIITNIFLFHMLIMIPSQSALMSYLYALFVMVNIFSYTSVLDHSRYMILAEIVKIGLAAYLILTNGVSWFGFDGLILQLVMAYLALSLFLTYYFYRTEPIAAIQT